MKTKISYDERIAGKGFRDFALRLKRLKLEGLQPSNVADDQEQYDPYRPSKVRSKLVAVNLPFKRIGAGPVS